MKLTDHSEASTSFHNAMSLCTVGNPITVRSPTYSAKKMLWTAQFEVSPV
jgi:hypothetical protein